MATNIDMPMTRPFMGATFSLGVNAPTSGAKGFYTGDMQRVSHLAQRLRGTLGWGPCRSRLDAAAREALLLQLQANGDRLRMGMPQRPVPLGTMRGTPAVSVAALAGARSVSVSGAPGGSTLVGGDIVGAGGNLLHTALAGVTFDGAGAAVVLLSLPLQRPIAAGTPLVWSNPTGLWELDDEGLMLDYSVGRIQGGVAIPLRQYIA